MKVKYYEIEEGISGISGEVTASVDFIEGDKADVFFRFWWNKKTRSFVTIDHGVLRFRNKDLVSFTRHGNLGHWMLKEHRDNFPSYSDTIGGVIEKLEAELAKKYPVDPSEYMEY